jgi:hypothetical protein
MNNYSRDRARFDREQVFVNSKKVCELARRRLQLANQLRELCHGMQEYQYYIARTSGNAENDIVMLQGFIDDLTQPDPAYFEYQPSDSDEIDCTPLGGW